VPLIAIDDGTIHALQQGPFLQGPIAGGGRIQVDGGIPWKSTRLDDLQILIAQKTGPSAVELSIQRSVKVGTSSVFPLAA
jgi:hypothetical protein